MLDIQWLGGIVRKMYGPVSAGLLGFGLTCVQPAEAETWQSTDAHSACFKEAFDSTHSTYYCPVFQNSDFTNASIRTVTGYFRGGASMQVCVNFYNAAGGSCNGLLSASGSYPSITGSASVWNNYASHYAYLSASSNLLGYDVAK